MVGREWLPLRKAALRQRCLTPAADDAVGCGAAAAGGLSRKQLQVTERSRWEHGT
jgi:hypothetical protein